MKKFAIGILVCAVVVTAMFVMALPDQALPTGGGFYEGAAESTARTAAIGVETAARIAADTAQSDTNATTTATAYTPRRVGDILVGGAGEGTNGVWIAKGTTTNDWVQVANAPPAEE